MTVRYQIHPSIGIARIGSSEEYFFGPEYSYESGFPPKGGFRDKPGLLLRQAARFRVFRVEQGADGRALATEVNPRDAKITWTVELANRKGVGRRLDPEEGEGKWRNDVTDPKDRAAKKRFVIAPKKGEISFDPDLIDVDDDRHSDLPVHAFKDGKFKEKDVPLGEMTVDRAGRLIVLGGRGNSGAVGDATPPEKLRFADNDGWYDDTSDGRVSARLEFPDGRKTAKGEVVPAWVLVGPPDYAPEIQNLITLYDLARQIAIGKGLRKPPARPHFDRDIRPILHRVFSYQWVNKYAAHRHGRGQPYDFEELKFWGRLGNPGADPGLRQRLFGRFRDPNRYEAESDPTAMPRIHDDIGNFGSYDERRVLAFLPFQYELLRQWSEGDFIGTGLPDPDPPHELLTEKIDRVSMDACVGGPFYPGIETWEIIRDGSLWAGTDLDPFRLNHFDKRLIPGRLTEGNALPWQSDFLDCAWEDGAAWWPAHRPDHVRIHPDSDELEDWTFGLGRYQGRHAGLGRNRAAPIDMIKHWDKLGFVVKALDSGGRDVFVEAQRDPGNVLARRSGRQGP